MGSTVNPLGLNGKITDIDRNYSCQYYYMKVHHYHAHFSPVHPRVCPYPVSVCMVIEKLLTVSGIDVSCRLNLVDEP